MASPSNRRSFTSRKEPAAFYGVYATDLIVNGKILKCAQSGDTMTHKDHIGKGLFTQLAKKTHELSKEKGVELIFGFPNSNSKPGFLKHLNWKCPQKMNDYSIKVLSVPFLKLMNKIGLGNLYNKFASSILIALFKPTISYMPNSCIDGKNMGGVSRALDFFKYKTAFGSFLIKVRGIHFWVKLEHVLVIGDLEISTNSSLIKSIRSLKLICFFLGIDRILFSASPNSGADKFFASHFAKKEGIDIGFCNLGGEIDTSKIGFVRGDFDTF